MERRGEGKEKTEEDRILGHSVRRTDGQRGADKGGMGVRRKTTREWMGNFQKEVSNGVKVRIEGED